MGLLIRGALAWSPRIAQPKPRDVWIDGPRIRRVDARIDPLPDDQVIDAAGHLLIPGLVNAHTHAHTHLSKGAVDGLPLELWLPYLAARSSGLTPRDLYVSTAVGALEMLKTGTTCACDMSQVTPLKADGIEAVVRAYVDLGLRATIAPQVTDLPLSRSFPGLEERLPETLRAELLSRAPANGYVGILKLLSGAAERWDGAGQGRIRLGVGPSVPTMCSDELLGGCAELGRDRGLSVQIHVAETRAGAYAAFERYGKSAIERLDELEMLGPNTVLAHCVWIDDHDMAVVADRGANISHNPISNLKLGSGIARLGAMLDHGCAVALGTDGSASSDNQNLFGVLRQAAILPRVVDHRLERWPDPGRVLAMATENGGRAAGFDGPLGVIEEGALADLVLIDISRVYYRPRNDLIAQLVHADVGSSVATVVVNGEVVLRDGRSTRVDEEALLAEADEIARRVSASVATAPGLGPVLRPFLASAIGSAAGKEKMRSLGDLSPLRVE